MKAGIIFDLEVRAAYRELLTMDERVTIMVALANRRIYWLENWREGHTHGWDTTYAAAQLQRVNDAEIRLNQLWYGHSGRPLDKEAA
jgi:hypothetical protein